MSDPEKTRILVVDDDPEIRTMLQVRLSSRGFAVAEASDGEQALAMVENDPPALIVLDIMMPNMSGWEVAKAIRKNSEYDNIGIIVVTAIGEKMSEMTSPLMGADDHIDKPFDFGVLESKVFKVLEAKGQPIPG